MQAPLCRLQEIELHLDLATLRDRGLTSLFEAARNCRHLKAMRVNVDKDDYGDSYVLDGDGCQALTDLLRSSTVLATLQLNSFSFEEEGFGRLASGLASCKSATAFLLMECSTGEGSLARLRSHLDELAQLEELTLDCCKEAHADLLRFVRDARIKLPRLRRLHLECRTVGEDREAPDAVANACLEHAKTNPHLRYLECKQVGKPFQPHGNELSFFLRLNRFGRRHLHPSHDVPLAHWPTILARTTTGSCDDCGVLYYFLRHKPALVRTRNGGVKRGS